MRSLAVFVAILSLAAACFGATPPASSTKIVRVFTGWKDAASFKRISEYFTGRENTGGEIVLRTQPAERAGYYFLVRTDSASGIAGRFMVEVVLPGASEPQHYVFPASVPAGQKVFQLGVTGRDWADHRVDAVAWRITLQDSTGATVATQQSYLWKMPSGT